VPGDGLEVRVAQRLPRGVPMLGAQVKVRGLEREVGSLGRRGEALEPLRHNLGPDAVAGDNGQTVGSTTTHRAAAPST
jgi:hypothetical protein